MHLHIRYNGRYSSFTIYESTFSQLKTLLVAEKIYENMEILFTIATCKYSHIMQFIGYFQYITGIFARIFRKRTDRNEVAMPVRYLQKLLARSTQDSSLI